MNVEIHTVFFDIAIKLNDLRTEIERYMEDGTYYSSRHHHEQTLKRIEIAQLAIKLQLGD